MRTRLKDVQRLTCALCLRPFKPHERHILRGTPPLPVHIDDPCPCYIGEINQKLLMLPFDEFVERLRICGCPGCVEFREQAIEWCKTRLFELP